MTIGSEILRAESNLKDCYDVIRGMDGVVLPESENFDNLAACIEQAKNPFNKPADWSDIRTDCPENSIALYAGHTADYSQYDNLGFSADCTGGYNVFIDGMQYGSTYTSGSTCTITWSTSGITTGDDITTPSALKAHKIWIEPATSGNNITAFRCRRVAASGTEEQGVMWAHFNLTNAITIRNAFGSETTIRNFLLEAVTAKNNLITYTVAESGSNSGFYSSFAFCSSLEYLPVLKAKNQTYPSGNYIAFRSVPAKKVVIKNNNGNENFGILNQTNVEEFVIENGLTLGSAMTANGAANSPTSLKKFPKINQNKAENFQMYNCPALEPVNIDDRFNDIRKVFRFYGTQSVPTPALKSLRVSNEAPFDGETPQIQVDYTDMDRDALVQLFNDLPYNVGYTVIGSPTINNGVVSGFSSQNYLMFNENLQLLNNDFEIYIKCSAPSVTSNQRILCNNYGSPGFSGVSLGNDKKFNFRIYEEDSSTVYKVDNTLIVSPNTTYFVKAYRAGTVLGISVSTDETNWHTATIDIPSTINLTRGNYQIGASSASVFSGSIDLNNTYIKVNDDYWFRGQPAMTKTLSCVGCSGNQDKLTIVGSPTINNGVVSGFSSSKYIKTSSNLPISSDEIFTTFTTGSDVSASQIIFSCGASFENRTLACTIESGGYFGYGYSKNGTAWADGYNTTNYLMSANTEYNISYSFSPSAVIVKIKESTETSWTEFTNQLTQSLYNSNTYLKFGVDLDLNKPFSGSIDLNNTYIKVNDELWFGREQYLLPEDKAIATDKGWALTLTA